MRLQCLCALAPAQVRTHPAVALPMQANATGTPTQACWNMPIGDRWLLARSRECLLPENSVQQRKQRRTFQLQRHQQQKDQRRQRQIETARQQGLFVDQAKQEIRRGPQANTAADHRPWTSRPSRTMMDNSVRAAVIAGPSRFSADPRLQSGGCPDPVCRSAAAGRPAARPRHLRRKAPRDRRQCPIPWCGPDGGTHRPARWPPGTV